MYLFQFEDVQIETNRKVLKLLTLVDEVNSWLNKDNEHEYKFSELAVQEFKLKNVKKYLDKYAHPAILVKFKKRLRFATFDVFN